MMSAKCGIDQRFEAARGRSAGHTADVDVVRWHPNSQYIATGSTDRSVCLWDVRTGDRVRILVSHRAEVRGR